MNVFQSELNYYIRDIRIQFINHINYQKMKKILLMLTIVGAVSFTMASCGSVEVTDLTEEGAGDDAGHDHADDEGDHEH